FSCHGMQKLLGLFPNPQMPTIEFGSQAWLGGVIELVCGLAIAFGLFTSWAAFLASGTMAVAYVQFHWMDQQHHLRFDPNFFPIVNQGELAVVYSILFLYIACRGAGKWSFEKDKPA